MLDILEDYLRWRSIASRRVDDDARRLSGKTAPFSGEGVLLMSASVRHGVDLSAVDTVVNFDVDLMAPAVFGALRQLGQEGTRVMVLRLVSIVCDADAKSIVGSHGSSCASVEGNCEFTPTSPSDLNKILARGDAESRAFAEVDAELLHSVRGLRCDSPVLVRCGRLMAPEEVPLCLHQRAGGA
uniref:Helicase C-terminal domain-containing protein n=1 Tax=Noctiluca scintillans TaxID=2966 RepID=A0A7S1AR96_NOCSC